MLRIGVNTGEVVAETERALVTGDAVNVAARLEQAAAPGEILIGDATYRVARAGCGRGRPERLEPRERASRSGRSGSSTCSRT